MFHYVPMYLIMSSIFGVNNSLCKIPWLKWNNCMQWLQLIKFRILDRLWNMWWYMIYTMYMLTKNASFLSGHSVNSLYGDLVNFTKDFATSFVPLCLLKEVGIFLSALFYHVYMWWSLNIKWKYLICYDFYFRFLFSQVVSTNSISISTIFLSHLHNP